MTEYNFRHQTKMMSIGLAKLRLAKPPRVDLRAIFQPISWASCTAGQRWRQIGSLDRIF
jgi:hypothetical protein